MCARHCCVLRMTGMARLMTRRTRSTCHVVIYRTTTMTSARQLIGARARRTVRRLQVTCRRALCCCCLACCQQCNTCTLLWPQRTHECSLCNVNVCTCTSVLTIMCCSSQNHGTYANRMCAESVTNASTLIIQSQ